MGLISFLLVLLVFSPILTGVVSLGLLNIKYSKNSDSIFLFLFIGFTLGFINTLKVPESDLVNYIRIFNNAGSYSFIDYLKIENKEFLFGSINYVLYYLLGGNFNYFLIIFTGISYALIFYAIRILDQNLKLGKESYMLAIIIAIFFPNLFSISAHLMRQFLASALVLVFLMKNVFEGPKKSIPFILTAILVHSSALFFAIAFIPNLNKKLSLIKVTTILVLIFSISLVLDSFSSYFLNIPIIGRAINRFVNRENAIWETEKLGMLNIIIQGVVLVLLYFGIVKNKNSQYRKLYKLFYVVIILVAFILANYNNTEIASRFNFYIYFLVPIAMYFFYKTIKIKDNNFKSLLSLFFIIIFLCWFIYKLNNGIWKYIDLDKIFLNF